MTLRIVSMATLLSLLALLHGCASSVKQVSSGASYEPGADVELLNCEEPKGPALVAGPWITDLNASGGSVVFTTGGAVAPVSVYVMDATAGCRAEDLYQPTNRFQASLITAADVPYGRSDDLIPSKTYHASFSVAPAPHARRFCYGLELPQPSWSHKPVSNHYFCQPALGQGHGGTSFLVPGSEQTELVFYAYGDTRDPSGYSEAHEEVADYLLDDLRRDLIEGNDAAAFIVNSGDFAYFGCDAGLWLANFFAPARSVLQQLPMYTAPGNHEGYSEDGGPPCPNLSYYFALFGQPYQGSRASAPGHVVHDVGNVRLVSLRVIDNTDSGCLEPFGVERHKGCETAPACPATPQSCDAADLCPYNWLRCQLNGHGHADWDSVDHVIVFNHAPLITAPPVGKHPSSDFQIEHLAPLYERPDGRGPGKVTAVINGHNHFYERSLPLAGLALTGDSGDDSSGFQFPPISYREDARYGINYIVSGGGGATPYSAPTGEFPKQWLSQAANAYHFLKLRIDGKQASLEALGFHADGTPFHDQATLRSSRSNEKQD